MLPYVTIIEIRAGGARMAWLPRAGFVAATLCLPLPEGISPVPGRGGFNPKHKVGLSSRSDDLRLTSAPYD